MEHFMSIISTLSRLTLPAFALAALAYVAPAPVAAQTEAEPPVVNPQDISQTQLESFVAAATRVSEITEELQSEAQGVEDEAALAELQERANTEMVAAVEDEGLTVEEYNMIFQVAQVDPEVNATLMEMMQR
jgi:hypothetical protein